MIHIYYLVRQTNCIYIQRYQKAYPFHQRLPVPTAAPLALTTSNRSVIRLTRSTEVVIPYLTQFGVFTRRYCVDLVHIVPEVSQ